MKTEGQFRHKRMRGMTAGIEWPRIAALTKQCALAHCHGESASSAYAVVIFSAGLLFRCC